MNRRVDIGVIGDYMPLRPSHMATDEALHHCAAHLGFELRLEWLPTRSLERCPDGELSRFDGFLCAPGEYGSTGGALAAIRFARETDTPFLGTCQGFQHAVMEYACNKLGLEDVRHAELEPGAVNPMITALSCSFIGETRKVYIKEDSRAFSYYNAPEAMERFTCSYGISPRYRALLEEGGLCVAGADERGEARLLELPRNGFFVATLFQPQLISTPETPHRLLLAFLKRLEKRRYM